MTRRAGTLGHSVTDTRPEAEEEARSEPGENILPGSSGPGWGGRGEEVTFEVDPKE